MVERSRKAQEVDQLVKAFAFMFTTASGEIPYSPSMEQVRRWAVQAHACGVRQLDEFADELPVLPQWMASAVTEGSRIEVGDPINHAAPAPPVARVGKAPKLPAKRHRKKK